MNLVNDKEIKVEKAILDLNEIKTKMFNEKVNDENTMRKTSTLNNFNKTSYSTQT
jgi:hypothetical protein